MAGVRRVHRIFGENDRIVVGEGDALAVRLRGRLGDGRRRRRVHQRVHLPRFRDVPVLAELAGEVAARGSEREHARTGIEVIERLFLDRIDAEPRRAAVGGEHHRIAFALAHEAGAALALVQAAVARAQVALDAAIVQKVPPAAGMVAHRCSSLTVEFALCPFSHAIAGNVHLRAPEILRKPGFPLQRGQEFARVGKRIPYLRQERRAPVAIPKNQAIQTGAKARDEVVLVDDVDRLVGGQQRNFDHHLLELEHRERRESAGRRTRPRSRSRARPHPAGAWAAATRCIRAARPARFSVTNVAPGCPSAA